MEMKRTFIFDFKILSKAWAVFHETIEIEDLNNYSLALDTALGQISQNYAKPMTITLNSFQIKIL